MINFLNELNLQEYLPLLKEDGIEDLETLLEYSGDELKALGLKTGHVKKILKALEISSEQHPPLIQEGAIVELKEHSKKKIFFSYGHDKHAELITKIKNDILEYGIEAWMDTEGLRAKDDWEETLEKAIEDSDEVVYFITPHSARRPDGYCLNELAYSLAIGKEITPVMLDYITPPLSICRTQWIDIQHLAQQFNEESYDKFLENIVDILKGVKTLDIEGSHISLSNKLDPMDFSYDIKKHIKNFVGREWLYNRVNQLINNDDANVLWITAEAGFGKSAFSTLLMHKHPNTVGIHFCEYDNPKRKNPTNVLMTLMYQLSTQIKEYKDFLEYTNKLKDLPNSPTHVILDELLIQPLNKIKMQKNYFFIIDALDEAEENGTNELADLVQKFSHLPSWLKIVITSRPEPYLKRKLSKLKMVELNAQSDENIDDLRAYIQQASSYKRCESFKEQNIANALLTKCEGNILYLKEVVDAMKQGDIRIDELNDLPKGMDGLYLNTFERYFKDTDSYEEQFLSFINIMVASKTGLPPTLIMSLLSIKERAYKKLLEAFGSLVEDNNGLLTFYHKSLFDWLSDYDKSGSYCADVDEGHNQIYTYFMEQFNEQDSLSSLSDFELDIFTKSILFLDKRSNDFNKEFNQYFITANESPEYVFKQDERANNLYTVSDDSIYSQTIEAIDSSRDKITFECLEKTDILNFFSLLVKVFKLSDLRLHKYIEDKMSKGLFSLLNFLSSNSEKNILIENLYIFVKNIFEKIEYGPLYEYRVIVISTFIDFVKEREILVEQVFPEITQFAKTMGVDFQYIVPGYGISGNFYLKQSFIEDHLRSIRGITSKYKTFPIFMIGNRYGWIPLPYQIERHSFENILLYKEQEDRLFLSQWYQLDTNTVPASYTLKQREGEYKSYEKWLVVENSLRTLLMTKKEYSVENSLNMISSTHFEVNEILTPQHSTEIKLNCIGVFRDINNREKYIEKFMDSEIGTESTHRLKAELSQEIHPDNILHYGIDARGNVDDQGIHNSDYYQAYESFVKEKILKDLKTDINSKQIISIIEEERFGQHKFNKNKTMIFVGRYNELSQMMNYLESSNNQLFIVTGDSASGKSSLLAKFTEEIENQLNYSVYYSFIGATTLSTNIKKLLEMLVSELGYKIDPALEIDDFYQEVKRLLSNITEPTVIIIDGLDQLSEKDYLHWLPFRLQSNLKIILSATSERNLSHYYDILYSNVEACNVCRLQEPTKEEISEILSSLLHQESRTLTNRQFDYALHQTARSGSPFLYLKIAFEEIKTWKSTDHDVSLPVTIEDMFDDYMDYLISIGHEEILIKRALGYLVASHNGLSEANIVDLLNNDLEVREAHSSGFHAYAVLPYSIINRFLLDISPFTKETIVNGERLINIEQRIVQSIITKKIYEAEKDYLHAHLVKYFLKRD